MGKKFKKLILAFIMTMSLMIFASCESQDETTESGAQLVESEVNLLESDVRLFVDGVEVATSTTLGGGIGDKPAFDVDERTFLAARAMGIAFERDIRWQPNTQTLYFGQMPTPTDLVSVTTSSASTYMSLEEIYALGMTQIDAVSNNDPVSFAGVSFEDLFAEMDVDVTNANYFIFVGADSFYNVATATDVLNAENGWLALYEDEQRLDTRTRVVLADDESPGRWVNDVKEIIVVEGEIPNVWEREINIVADGVTVNQEDTNGDQAVLMHHGKIYMPLYETAVALGMPVEFNESENSIMVGEGDVEGTPDVDVADGGEIAIDAGGMQFIVTMEDILAIGIEDFYAVVRDERVDYTGVSIASIMEFLNLDTTTATGEVVFAARDGHETAGTVDEVFDPTNGFVAISEDGELLGHWEAGGRGPFMLVFAHDEFAQRFLRYLTEINIDMSEPADELTDDPADSIEISVGERTYNFNLTDLLEFDSVSIDVVFRGEDRNFTGVPANDIFNALNIDIEGFTGGVVISGDDGFTQPFTIDELLDDTNFFLAFAEEGEELAYIMSVFAHDDRPTRGVRELSIIRLLDGEEDVGSAIEDLEEGEFAIIHGNESWTITMDDLEEIGFEDFTTNIPTGDESTRHFTGVRLTSILDNFDIDVSGATNMITTSVDSTFNAAWDIVADLDYAFIAVGEDGEVLDSHYGPFMGVVKDRGGNFNPRNLESIAIN